MDIVTDLLILRNHRDDNKTKGLLVHREYNDELNCTRLKVYIMAHLKLTILINE